MNENHLLVTILYMTALVVIIAAVAIGPMIERKFHRMQRRHLREDSQRRHGAAL